MWRWLFACGVTAISVSLYVFFERPYLAGPHAMYAPGAITASWLAAMIVASPTILYYWLLIFAGERALRRCPLVGAVLLVIAGATLPPLIHNAVVARAAERREFVGPVARLADTVAVEEGHFEPSDAMARGLVECRASCLRLLYGHGARRVVVGDPSATASWIRRSNVLAGEPMSYPTAYALRVERRQFCPDALTVTDGTSRDRFPVGPRLNAWIDHDRHPSLEDRVIALIAAGNCLVARPSQFLEADLRIGREISGPEGLRSLAPDNIGLFAASYSFVDRRDGATWSRLSQRMERSWSTKWLYPFAFLPTRRAAFASTRNVIEPAGEADMRQPWAWAGITLPMPPYIGRDRVRALLAAALDLPPGAPRDARHRLARQYIAGLAEQPADAIDRALLPRIVADPRVPVADLDALPRMLSPDEAASVGRRLVERIGLTPAGHRDIRALSNLVAQLPREAWPAILPSARVIAADQERAGDAERLFAIYAAGDANDAAALLALFGRNWPPLSIESTPPLSEENRQMFWRASEARQRRTAAYLGGLCALADTGPMIRPALIEASRASPPGRAYGASPALWGTMSAMGIDIERLAAERGLDAALRQEIAQIAHQPRARCTPRPPGAAYPAGPNPYSLPGAPTTLAFTLDIATLLALVSGATWGTIAIARRRRRRVGQATSP